MNLIKRSPESLEALLCCDQYADYLGIPTYDNGVVRLDTQPEQHSVYFFTPEKSKNCSNSHFSGRMLLFGF